MPVQSTNIVWTDDSANHWVGCAKVSEGCNACWAAAVADRFDRTDEPWTVANVDANLQVYDENIGDRLGRREPAWCFFPSSSDPFLPWLTDVALCPGSGCDETLWIGEGGLRCRECGWYGYAVELTSAYHQYRFALQANRQHCFQVLTKWGPEVDRSNQDARPDEYEPNTCIDPLGDHVMLGVTVEHPRRLYRLDWLRKQPAETKFVSFEPLIERIPNPDLSGIDWAIIGGETGPKDVRREMDPGWARDLISDCWRQGVAPLFKQHSDRYPEQRTTIDMGDGPIEVHEFPDVPASVPPAPREFVEPEVVV